MFINILLIFFGIVLLGALVFFSWVLWGAFRYGAPLVSTSKKVRKEMIALANIHQGDVVCDLGCGVGAILFEVARNSSGNVKCFGCDLVRPAILFARIKNHLLKKNIQFECADFFQKDLSDADVIFCYLLPSVMERIYREKWEELKPGCKIISHGFSLPPLKPTHTEPVGKVNIYVYEKGGESKS